MMDSSINELEKKQIDVIIEEYKTLRQESLNTINNRVSIMGFSFASLSIIASVTVSAKIPAGIVAIILEFVVPILAKTVSHVWIGEYERSQRAGASIADLENIVNARLGGQKLLSWENMLRAKESNKLNIPYRATMKLFSFIGYASEVFSLYYCALAFLDPTSMVPESLAHIFPKSGDVKVVLIGTVIFGLVVLCVEMRMQKE